MHVNSFDAFIYPNLFGTLYYCKSSLGNLARPSNTPKDIPARAPVYNKPKPGPIKDSTSFYCINPSTKTEVGTASTLVLKLRLVDLMGTLFLLKYHKVISNNPAILGVIRLLTTQSYLRASPMMSRQPR